MGVNVMKIKGSGKRHNYMTCAVQCVLKGAAGSLFGGIGRGKENKASYEKYGKLRKKKIKTQINV